MKAARIVLPVVTTGLMTSMFFARVLPMVPGSGHQAYREPVPAPAWRSEVVAPGVDFSNLGAPSFALDPYGYPHIAFGQNRLLHTWFDGVLWQSETVDSTRSLARDSVLAIDAAGVITIGDIANEKVSVHTLEPGGMWQTAEIPLPGLSGANYLALALDSGGRPHLAAAQFSPGSHAFIYARKTSHRWTAEAVGTEGTVYGPLSITLDSEDRPVILYGQFNDAGQNELLIARLVDGSWQHEPIATGLLIVGKSLALDGQDIAHAVFSDHEDGRLVYLSEGDHGWEMMQLAGGGYYPGLALDSAGRPHIVYADPGGQQVYATLAAGSWQKTIIQEGEYAGLYNTLVLDQAGAAHVVSLDTDLKYAGNSSGRWLVSTVAVPTSLGSQNALDLDSADKAYIFYNNSATGELFLGSGDANNWQTDLVAHVMQDNLDLAIALDEQGNVHIAYTDSMEDSLVVGMRQAGEWSFQQIAAGGQYLSLKVGSDNRPQLILEQDGTLAYWSKNGDDWQSEIVSGTDDGIYNPRLALDSDNRPHVIYARAGNSAYAVRQAAGGWLVQELPFESVDDLAIGPGDKAHILHTVYKQVGGERYPEIHYDLWLAERSGSGWIDELLWEDAGTARLAVDANNRLHVAFYDYLQRDESGSWLFENPVWLNTGDINLELGRDGQPRVATFDGDSLVLSTREIIWLDKFSLLPVIAR